MISNQVTVLTIHQNLEAKSSQLKGLAKPERGNPFRQKNIDDKGNHQLPPTGMKNGKVASTAGERRSRSVQQARQNNDGCAERDSSTTRRPSSISSNRDGVQPLKGPPTKHKKVAGLGFGSAVGRNLSKQKEKDANGKNGRVVRSDSNDNNSNALPAKKSQMTGVNVIGNQGRLRVDTVGADRKQQLISRVYSDEGGSPKNAAGGFAKLQLQAANSRRIVGGPQIVLHEEDSSGYNGKATGRSIELSGQSEYIKIPAAESDILGGDQLDALLKQARRARN